MASNVEVKREFERISHEYINIKRFSNPLNEALSRLENGKKPLGIKQKGTQNNLERRTPPNSMFSNYMSSSKPTDEVILPELQNTKIQRILSSMWREESSLFIKDNNPLNRISHSSNMSTNSLRPRSTSNKHYSSQNVRHSLRGPGSSTNLHHQRVVNSLQPTTRAVNRRMENHQQR